MSYPLEQLFQEVAFIAYHFHWSRDDIYHFPHPERKRWVEHISRINEIISREDD